MEIVVTSREHPIAKRIRLVASGARRAPPELVLAEGLRVLEEATRAGHRIEAALVAPEFGRRDREQVLLGAWAERSVRVFRAGGALLRSLSEVLEPQGAVALIALPPLGDGKLERLEASLVVCGSGIRDPGNLGTIVRSAAAAGADAVWTTTDTVSPRNPKAVRASAGALFRIPIAEGRAPGQVLDWCRRRKLRVLRADVSSGVPYWDADLSGPVALVLGSEAHGLRDPVWRESEAVHIPMAEGVESLNVAAAATLLLFEAARQRRAGTRP